MTEEEELEVGKEVEEMLKNKTVTLQQNKPEQFLNSIFIIPKKSEGFRSVINLRKLNSCVEQNHFLLN